MTPDRVIYRGQVHNVIARGYLGDPNQYKLESRHPDGSPFGAKVSECSHVGPLPIYRTYDPEARRYVEVSEFTPGLIVIAMYWSTTARKYMTVPGASLFVVDDNGDLVLAED